MHRAWSSLRASSDDDELVVGKDPAGDARQRKRVLPVHPKSEQFGEPTKFGKTAESHVRRVARVALFLRADEDDLAPRTQVIEVLPGDGQPLRFTNVLDHVCQQQGIERATLGVLRSVETGDGEGGQAAISGDRDRGSVVVNADAGATQVLKIASDATPDVEDAAEVEPANVPPVGGLYVEHPFPASRLEPLQSSRIVRSRGVLASHSGRCGRHLSYGAIIAAIHSIEPNGRHGSVGSPAVQQASSGRSSPLLSVVVLAYGDEPRLGEAVRAVLGSRDGHGQSLDLEVVLVDNGARQEAVSPVARLPRVRMLTPEENLGFAGGCNLGAAESQAQFLALVNSDALVSEDALAMLLEVAAEPGVGIATSSLRLAKAPDTINSAGNPLHLTGLVWAGSHGQPAARHCKRRQVACASGAALMLRRGLWAELGGFAPEYFAYHEDTELSLRCWQRGLSVVYVPDAVVLHHYEFSRNPMKLYLVERNRLVLLATAYSGRLLFLLSPLLLVFEIAVACASAAGGWWSQKFAGWRWVVGNLGWIRRRRAQLQSERTISDRQLVGLFSSRLDAANADIPRIVSVLDPVVTGYWSVVRRLL